MSLNHLSITVPLTDHSTHTSTPYLNHVPLGNKERLPKDHLQKVTSSCFTEIMKYLSPYQICVLTSVSSFLYDPFDENRWVPLCRHFFPESYKKHTECLKSSAWNSRHFFMSQFHMMNGLTTLNTQQKSDFSFAAALSERLFLFQNRKSNLILWNIKKGKTIKQWAKSDPIQELFMSSIRQHHQVFLDGRRICYNNRNLSTLIVLDLIGEDKAITLPYKDDLTAMTAFGKSQIIYATGTIDNTVWNIWDIFEKSPKILLLSPEVKNVHVLDDNHIITSSEKTLKDTARTVTELAVWHVSSQQTIKTCTEATWIIFDPVVLNKRWVVYTGGNKVRVWDTLNDKKSDFPASPASASPCSLAALNERLVTYYPVGGKFNETLKVIDVFEGRQRDIPNTLSPEKPISFNNGFFISSTEFRPLAIWDNSAYKEALLKHTHSSSSSSRSDTSSSSSSSSSSTSSLMLPD